MCVSYPSLVIYQLCMSFSVDVFVISFLYFLHKHFIFSPNFLYSFMQLTHCLWQMRLNEHALVDAAVLSFTFSKGLPLPIGMWIQIVYKYHQNLFTNS